MPTRHRLALVQRFLDSLAAATDRLDKIEVVLGVDDDDPESHVITHSKIPLKIVIVPRGGTMGQLNQKCFEASTGRFVFAMNDDVIAETKGWDTRVYEILRRFPDDIVLVHVNDDLFGRRLCTFPIISRRSCLEIGAFGLQYRRYKIDDHIYETYALLEKLGYNRVVFLEDVLFRHENFGESHEVNVTQTAFFAADGKRYAPLLDVLATDQIEYERQIDVRKLNARKLADLIERTRHGEACRKSQGSAPALGAPPVNGTVWYEDDIRHQARLRSHVNRLAGIRDPQTYRGSHLSELPPRPSMAMRSRLGIVLLANDVSSASAKRSLAALQIHARGIGLSVVSANGQPSFSLAQASGQALAATSSDFLLLMEAGVVIGPDTINLLLESLDDEVAIVAPIYLDSRGNIISSGLYVDGARPEWLQDYRNMPAAICKRRAVRHGLLLIDLTKMGNPLIDPAYCLNFFDVDLCLRAWDAGFAAACTPQISVVLPETFETDAASARLWYDADGAVFLQNWNEPGKISEFEQKAWSAHSTCLERPPVPALPGIKPKGSDLWLGTFMDFIQTNPYAMRTAMKAGAFKRRLTSLHGKLPGYFKRQTQPFIGFLEKAYGKASASQGLREAGTYRDYRLVRFDGVICAIPSSLAGIPVNVSILKLPDVYVATSEAAIRAKIDQNRDADGPVRTIPVSTPI
jgi:hypothetical protein